MTLYAVEAIDDAIDATRAFLWPIDRSRWLRLAVVVFFVGGTAGFSPFQFTGGAPTGNGAETSLPTDAPAPSPELVAPGGVELLVVAIIVGLVAAILLGFLFVGSVMEFVFVESLRQEAVSIRRYWSTRWRLGARLFGFRLVVGVLTLGTVLGLLAVILSPLVFGNGGVSLALVVLAIPLLVVVGLVSGLIGGFTTNFVVPIMLVEERPLLSAWRRFWPTLRKQWKQYAVYAVAAFVLQLAIGLLASIATVLGAIVAAIPLGIVGLVGVALVSVVDPVGWIVVAGAVLLFLLVAFLIGLLVAVPAQTYLRYYALFVLGDTEDDFDLIPARRQAVRE
ncbi:hypothetical protein DVK02_11315 [Halobellus sp. Atlit-31R]|nr:hypothetical protein DVK02_11315 [Halobellus sp. Atlit-31R]